ncbi:MAG: hypothetical protein IRY84_18335, partial [Thermobispora bispora]|nr:hypothetical protein [Thermobispora bispora]
MTPLGHRTPGSNHVIPPSPPAAPRHPAPSGGPSGHPAGVPSATPPVRSPEIDYVLPLRWHDDAGLAELTGYLRGLARYA